MILLFLNSFGQVTSNQLNDENLLSILEFSGLVHDELEGIGDDFLQRNNWTCILAFFLPPCLIVLLTCIIKFTESLNEFDELILFKFINCWRLVKHVLHHL